MTEQQQPGEEARLRRHPRERFAASERVLDLEKVDRELMQEAHPALDGRRQIALNKNGPVTQVFFHFEKGGFMPEHAADGYVTIHVLDGAFRITTPDAVHELDAQMMLLLDPCIPHRVEAVEAGRMLLTVCLAEG